MKTIIFYLAFSLAFTLLSVTSHSYPIEVKLKANEVLIYEWTAKEVFLFPNKTQATDRIQTNRFSIIIGQIDGNKLTFTAQTVKQTEKHLQSDDLYAKDFAFPPFINYFWEFKEYGTDFEMLYPTKFKYELDIKTGEIQLTNRLEILEQCHKILSDKGYSDQIRSEIIEKINNKTLQQQSELFLIPFSLLNEDLDQPILNFEKFGSNISVRKRDAGIVDMESLPNDTISKLSGQLDLQTRLLTHFLEEKPIDKTEQGFSAAWYGTNLKIKKVSELTLIKKTEKKIQKLIVCGHIENPINDHIVLYTLNHAFANAPDSKDVNLDEAGNFRIETKLEQAGLVILMQPNKKQNINTTVFLLYAEPGDSIFVKSGFAMKTIEVGSRMNKEEFKYFENFKKSADKKTSTGNFLNPWVAFKTNKSVRNDTIVKFPKNIMMYHSVEFSGDRKAEAEFLMKYQQEWGLPPYNSTYNSLLFDEGQPGIDVYFYALDKLKDMLKVHRREMNSEAATYLEHELQALIYSRLFEAIPSSTIPPSVFIGVNLIPENQEEKVKNRLDSIQIHRIYNDYGIFSREMAMKYVWYKYRQLIPANPIISREADYILPTDLERTIQFTKMVLSGSAMYRTMVQQLYTSSFDFRGFAPVKSIWHSYAIETLALIQKRSNDEDLNRAIETIFQNQSLWEYSRYLPEVTFYDLHQKDVSLRNFISKKPAIFFAGANWSTSRYEMDDAVKANQEIAFVLINEGTNFNLWKDWNSRAESLSNQLFLLSDSIRLTDIFQDKLGKYLIYNSLGERIGVEKDLDKAISLAKDSLKAPKKEINKSTLQGIIIVLAGSLLFFLILFLAYKYRVKQRLKKEMQEKRLRELQMAAIRAQMNPHFLFNSLNSVQNLIQQNRASEAHLYLSDFAGLIRKVLRNSDKEEVSLAEELETLEQYLNLEKLRFDFEYGIVVDKEIDQNLFMLPSMILQPVAENALMHGLQHKTGDKKLSIQIQKIKSAIQITIEDNGIGIEEAKKLKTKSNGVGLRMNEERIQMMKEKYGGTYSFRLIDLTEQNGEGTRVEILIPEEI
ncbi:MAG: histidine kinase [Prolixibacteraceae bacterium]|nr:histidine kinase [Prolixibacteraceae bacterium]